MLLVSEAWKSNILPIVKPVLAKIVSIKGYLLLYH